MRNTILAFSLALLGFQSAIAEDHFYVGSSVGLTFVDESRFLPGQDKDTAGILGFQVGYEFAERYAAELAATTNLSDTDLDSIELSLYNFFSSNRRGQTPYLVFGLSSMEMDATQVRTDQTHNAVLGFGVSNYLSEFMELKVDARLTNALDDAAAGDNSVDLGFRAALNYHFGKVDSVAAAAPAAAIPATIPVAQRAPARVGPAPAPVAAAPARTITVELEVLFAFNSAQVTQAGAEMAQMAAALQSQPDLMLTLEGHTDSVGDAAYNQSLSQRRVDAVKAELVNTYGAPADRIEAIGYGESRPIADNGTADGRAQNRRVVGVISFEAAQ